MTFIHTDENLLAPSADTLSCMNDHRPPCASSYEFRHISLRPIFPNRLLSCSLIQNHDTYLNTNNHSNLRPTLTSSSTAKLNPPTMHLLPSLLALLLGTNIVLSAENGRCDGVPGICFKTSKCQREGGRSVSGKCPSDPNDVKCCSSIPCGSGSNSGDCTWTDDCNTRLNTLKTGLCPGPANFQCCVPKFV
jgi:hypothetical protein